MSDQWFVHSNDQQMGPYTGAQLVEYAQQGNIVPETMVWTEGMAEWSPASQIPGLFPEAPAPVAVAAATTSAAWAPPGSRLAAAGAVAGTQAVSSYATAIAPVGGEYPMVMVNKSSFGLWLGTFVGGFVLFFISMIMMISGAVAGAKADAASPDGDAGMVGAGQAGIGFILYLLSLVALLVATIFFCINLYRAWRCLQPGGAQTTPGKAIGLMFIPFFNIYWVFVAINGLPKDWNRIVASYDDLQTAPKLGETTFLLYCIGVFFPPLLLIMIFPMMSQLCKGINFFAARGNPNGPSASGVFGAKVATGVPAAGGFKFPT